jgi:hypothetical protein
MVDDSVLECRIVPFHGRESPHFVLAPNDEVVLSSGLVDRLRDRCMLARLMAVPVVLVSALALIHLGCLRGIS